MNPATWAVTLSVSVFLGMVACLEVGFRIGRRTSRTSPELAHEGIGVLEAAVFALLGLLLGFSFAGSTSRLDNRRQLIVEEANAIGTAYLRLDLLTANDQPEMRRLFREYLDARLHMNDVPSEKEREQWMARAEQIQQEIWVRAVNASRADEKTALLLLPSVNGMIDLTTTRMVAARTHMPMLIFALLTCVALLSGVLAGYAMSKRTKRSWLHVFLYAVVVATTIYTILDLDFPRYGLIRVDAADTALRQLRGSIQ